MSNNTYTAKVTSFWKFIQENEIEIPIIQRDYAQGRQGEENLRKNFLSDLKNALDSDSGETMKLDFVYGTIENDKLNPLDGQQRLTTLWLLHWYIALRAEKLKEDNCKAFKNFTYETRISSREFCQNLCDPDNFNSFEGNDIVGFITRQTWFYSSWKQDPTIQSMLRMLGGTKVVDNKREDIVDGIEELFTETRSFEKYWKKLTSDNAPIVFYHLPLKGFGLSDDLYIKMNARGKQLTSFENFKADLVGYIAKQSEYEPKGQEEWKNLLEPKNGIPIKLDTEWTDIFWKNKSIGIKYEEKKRKSSDQIDEIYFTFLNRFFWNELFIAKKSNNAEEYVLDIGKGDESSTQENNNPSYKYLNNSEHENDTTIAYKGLEVYRFVNCEIPLAFFQKLKRVLENYFKYSKENDISLLKCPWETTSFSFIPIYEVKDDNNIEITNNANDKILSVSTLNQVQRIVFFAICKYFDHDDGVSDSVKLKRWMRVVWNLVSGEDQNGRPEIRSTSAMRTAIEFINSLNPHDVYNSLAEKIISGTTSFEERCKEEIAKANQILKEEKRKDGKSWEEIIIEAEKYAFFKGSIRFLFTKKNMGDDWGGFDTKWENAQEYFDGNNVDEYSYLNLRKFINQCSTNTELKNIIYDILPASWKINLLNGYLANVTHRFLSDDSNTIQNNEDAVWQKVKEDLTNTDLLKNLSYNGSHVNGCRLRDDKYGQIALFPSGANSDQKKYVIGNIRNTILSTLVGKNVKCNQKIEKCNFFWGWNINFEYTKDGKCFAFQWNTDGNVYLIENNNRKKKDDCSFYCFQADGIDKSENFINELDDLIKDAQENGNYEQTSEQ
jgi:hypothetical protein